MFSDKIYKNAQSRFGEHQLRLFGDFLNQQNILFERLSVWGYSNDNDDQISSSSSSLSFSNQTNDFNEFYCNPELSSYHLNKKQIQPIEINNSLQNYENISKFQLIKTDNILNKIILTFHQLCDECEDICKLCKEYIKKILYLNEDLYTKENLLLFNIYNNNNNNSTTTKTNNNGASTTIPNQSEKCFIKLSKSLKFLCDMHYLTQYCILICITILRQLAALYTNDSDIYLNNLQLEPVFASLGKLLKQIITFDEIFGNSNFLKFWPSFKKTISSASGNQQILNEFNQNEIAGLINVLNDIQIKLFNGNLFQNFLDNTYKIKQEFNSKSIGIFSNHFQDYIRTILSTISKLSSDLSEFNESDIFIEINGLCVLFHNFFGQIDQKCVKNLIEYNSKHIGITLTGNIIWCPEHFLRKHAETLVKTYDKYFNNATRLRQIHLQTKNQTLRRDVKNYCIQISLWSIHIKSLLNVTVCDLKSENFKQSCSLFLQGLQYAGQINFIIKSVANLHILLHLDMNTQCITLICKLIEYLKIIQDIFTKNMEKILKIMQCIVQYLQYKGLILITSAKKRLENESYSDRNVDILSALQIAEKCLCGTSSKSRLMLLNISISVTNPINLFSSDYKKFQKIINRLELLNKFNDNLSELCEPSFIFWNQSTFLNNIKNQGNSNEFIYLLKYSDECCKFLNSLNIDYLELSDDIKKNNYEKYKTEILEKLCIQIEIFLRLEVHSEELSALIQNQNQQEQQQQNKLLTPYNMDSICDHRDLIQKFKIQMNENHIILKNNIEDYFSNTFYNLTTIALHDWKIYGEMRHLAQKKYNLYSIDDYLPNQTYEQGIDILEIMRNIHLFVTKYRYNMNNQIFVEQTSKNKYLNTIGIQNIANSLRTHGTGILNTSVNFTYQFLRKKFYTFSQFLYDEQIRSRLMKDLKYFRDNCEKLNQMYSYDRADNFNKGIRKLGVMNDGQSYLDLFRQLITHIGNAMGFIRLIRSGGIHANYNASVFLPKFDDDDYDNKFTELSKESNLSEIIINAAQNLDENIKNFHSNTSKKIEYFHLLLDAFSGFFRNPKNIHLKTFYLIVPPLTINFVEHMLMAKDKIYKNDAKKHSHHHLSSYPSPNGDGNNNNNNNNNIDNSGNNIGDSSALFFDDGFAIGLTYILKLLNQITEFNSLHWFKSVKNKFELERLNIQQQQKDILQSSNNNQLLDEKLQQTLSLTEKRIKAYEIEFNLLYYNLSSAKIFFQ